MSHSNISFFIPHLGCPNQCSFCNQKSITGTVKPPSADDVRAVCEKALLYISDKENTEIAFFGGSFTAIEKGYMLSLLTAAREFIGLGKFKGIRISTRPDCIDEEILKLLKEYSVTSVELGAQSMNDAVLDANSRGHSADDVRIASCLIRQFGFELGLQMMVGLYKSTPECDFFTAEELIKLSPDTVRIYPTVILEKTRLAQLFLSGEYIPFSMDTAVELCSRLILEFEKAKIRIIKLGLHASELVESGMLGGIYHPAFRELCESRLFLTDIQNRLKDKPCKGYTVNVAEGSVSKAVGQKRENILKLQKSGYNIKIMPNKDLYGYEIEIAEEENACT